MSSTSKKNKNKDKVHDNIVKTYVKQYLALLDRVGDVMVDHCIHGDKGGLLAVFKGDVKEFYENASLTVHDYERAYGRLTPQLEVLDQYLSNIDDIQHMLTHNC